MDISRTTRWPTSSSQGRNGGCARARLEPGRARHRRRDAPARAGNSDFAGLWKRLRRGEVVGLRVGDLSDCLDASRARQGQQGSGRRAAKDRCAERAVGSGSTCIRTCSGTATRPSSSSAARTSGTFGICWVTSPSRPRRSIRTSALRGGGSCSCSNRRGTYEVLLSPRREISYKRHGSGAT